MKRRALLVVVLLVVVGLGGLVLALADQNRELSSRYESLRERTQWPHAGYAVPTFRARTLAGDTLTLGETGPGQKQLLFVFDTECPYCLATLPAWNSRLGQLEDGPAVDSVLAAAGLPEALSRPLAGGNMDPEPQEVQP